MKECILILFCSLIISCKTNTPLFNYIKISGNENSSILIIEDKIPPKILEQNLKYKLNLDSINNIENELKKHYQEIVLECKQDSINEKWEKENFIDLKKIIIIKSDNIFNEKNMLIKNGNRLFYSFSKLYYSKNKNLVSFYVSRSDGWNSIFFGVITMKKIKNSWKLVDKIESTELN
ncbi:hypothetical protein ACFO3U_08110 [Flavobacterium ponti]|uniref:Lipoprotein n=1 Tax=Flavobacterium ponti TaxID=665133 RepID=A0ABV9P433_9FLAO